MQSQILNPLLAKVKLPGRVFQLPSKGLFYAPGDVLHESVKDGEIQVKPMSALTEIKLRSADLLLSGKIIKEVCQECCPEIIHPEKMITKDIDALFVFLVVSTYGGTKTVRALHDCDNADIHDYQVSLDALLGNPRNECLMHREMLYSVTLDNGQVVKLRPTTFFDSMNMTIMRQEVDRNEHATHADIERLIVSDLLGVIEAVDDPALNIHVTDKNLIAEWIRNLSKAQSEAIVNAANKSAEWGLDFDAKLKCRDCGEVFTYELDMNPINFFSG